MKITEEIREKLFSLKDEGYRDFQSALIPNIDKSTVIGVRTPLLRALAREYCKDGRVEEFLSDLPHKYFEESNLHCFIIGEIKDFEKAVTEVNKILPYVDNWATCDQMRPKSFKKENERLRVNIDLWLASNMPYTRRFGIEMLMTFFLDEKFKKEQHRAVIDTVGGEYYVDMMKAWYFATALAKQWNDTAFVLTERLLDTFTHNMTIRKATESYRITPKQKELLKSLKIKNP